MEESWAVVSRRDGRIYLRGPYADDELEAPPDDVDDPRVHVQVPSKRELDLGRTLAMDFARSCGPELYDSVGEIFRRKGAFGRFRGWLDAKGLTDRWHDFQQAAIERELRAWAEEEGFEVI